MTMTTTKHSPFFRLRDPKVSMALRAPLANMFHDQSELYIARGVAPLTARESSALAPTLRTRRYECGGGFNQRQLERYSPPLPLFFFFVTSLFHFWVAILFPPPKIR